MVINAKLSPGNSVFRDFLGEVKPIRLREPLAETLGVFKEGDGTLEYSYLDVVKLAGHACPTTAGAYLACQEALAKLYPGDIPVRGEIAVTVYGAADEGVYGVVAQVFTLVTGAAPNTGFHGLGHRFKRKDLLRFSPEKIDPAAICVEFRRQDSGQAVLVKFYPHQVPFSEEQARQMTKLLPTVLWEVARPEERDAFQELWLDKVKAMLLERKGIEKWLVVEERRK